MNSLIDVDTNAIKSAFKIDQSKINVDFGNLNNVLTKNSLPSLNIEDIVKDIKFSISSKDLSNLMNDILKGYQKYIQKNPEADINQISKQLSEYLQSKEASEIINKKIQEIIQETGDLSFTEEQLQEIMTEVLKGYNKYVDDNKLVTVDNLNKYLLEFLDSEDAKKIIATNITEMIKSQNLDKQISNIMEDYIQTALSSLSIDLQNEMQSSISNLANSISNAISIDGNAFIGAFKMKMDENELSELMNSLMSKESVTYEGNLKKLNYANLEEPSGISIYPKDFEGNEAISNILNEYNEKMKSIGEEDKVISYTDMVGTLMSSVTTIVDTISYVLIAFVAISLVVSSIMIGVITYISVLERKKEIGILRAMGASKHNVAQVFNAETIIIGALAGLVGVGITLLLIIPINKIISVLSNGANVKAALPVVAGISLVIISIVLTLIGGIIPSRKAAKEDPVLALRSE